MAYFSLHAYDADVWIPQFKGLNQADVGLNPDLRFASEVENVETPNGVLQPQAAPIINDGPKDSDGYYPKVETLIKLHRRWYTGDLGTKNWYVCAAGGKLYQKPEGRQYIGWEEINMPEGVDAFQNNLWSWVTYEKNYVDSEENAYTVDVVLISNADDGMFMVIPPDTPSTWDVVKTAYTDWDAVGDTTWDDVFSPRWTIASVETRTDPEDDEEPQKRFSVIERFNERIFGTGVPEEPDVIYWSRAYDPEDWTEHPTIPEESAGENRLPTWDGDKFFALKRFGDRLLAFKKNKIWCIMGSDPGNYVFQEQYGDGTEYFDTIAVYKQRAFMANVNGVQIYDGQSTSSYAKEQIEPLWRTVNRNAMSQMCGCFFNEKYYLAFPTGTSKVNNAMLVFNMIEGTILYYKDFYIEDFLPTDEVLFATSSTMPGKILQLRYDSWVAGEANNAPTKWVSPWMDFGYKRIQKGGFEWYFIPEVQDEPVTFILTIQTEKKKKTKTYTCQPLTAEQRAVPKEHRGKRIHFGGNGRKFRIMVETEAGSAPWRLIGGLQLVVETDPD